MISYDTDIQNTPEKAHNSDLIKIGISQGDTNGVGYELILKTFSDPGMLELCTPIIFGHVKVANFHRKTLGLNTPLQVIARAEDAVAGKLNIVNCSDDEINVEFGKPCAESGMAAFTSLEKAAESYKNGAFDVLVTAPISKSDIQNDEFRFVGHTEYLQDRFGNETTEPLMILFNDIMRVALMTTHVPISEVAFSITEEKIQQKARLLYNALRQDFCISAPRIAILAHNPHAGEEGLLGHEEIEIITPTIKTLSDAGIPCFGPYAADGFFGTAQYRHFDGILAMYHDQGLAPFKALSMNDGVNFTAGLPIIRTSPDHGTAFDIAGKGIASADSFRQAVYAAIDIYRNRKAYMECHANPLPKIFQDKRER